jgi:Subtilase family
MSLLRDRVAKRTLLVLAVAAAVLVLPASVIADSQNAAAGPGAVETASDGALDKLHPALEAKVAEGSTADVKVYVTARGSAEQARALLDGARVAGNGGVSLAVGEISVQELAKLASLKNVVSVGPVDFKQTGKPLGSPDPQLERAFHKEQVNAALQGLYKREVPYSHAPKLRGSNFEKLKELAILDVKTHNFVSAWNAGFTGAGVTLGVMDGGTDFGHPDLIGTWKTWTNAFDPGWNGWPMAFDPFGTLQWLSAPSQISQGLSWYVLTQSKTCAVSGTGKKAKCTVNFATRTGPSRNFNAPAGTVAHDYTFPASWSKSGTVRLGSHPDDHLLLLFGERPAFLVTDPNTAGTYDTVYVDLDGDYSFADEKPVTKGSPASYRDMNGDGYTDLSGGLLYFISDGVTNVPGGIDWFGGVDGDGSDAGLFAKGQLLAWTGDFDPAIGGHGTLTASNVVGQGVINGKAPCFSDLRPGKSGATSCGSAKGGKGHGHGDDDDDDDRRGGTYPGAVIGGAPHAKLAPYGDIYFSFDFSIQFGYFLATREGVDITTNSYGSSATDNDGYDAASQEADIIHANRRTTPLFSTGNGAPGFGTTAPPSPAAGVAVGASTQFGGTGWDSIDRARQIVDNDVMTWSNRGFGATGSPGVDVVADGAYSAGDATLNTVLDGDVAWATWGGTSRSAPVAGAAAALVYQAYRQANPGVVPPAFYKTVKDVLKSSAKDLGYESTIQGAGSVDAGDAVKSALGTRARVSPNEWRVGDYRGAEYDVFAHVISPGGADTQSFTVNGPGTWSVSDRMLKRTASETFSLTSKNIANESPYNFNAPDYLRDLSSMIKSHKNADLMVVRTTYPRAQFDPNGDYAADQAWRPLLYSWTDIDRDRRLWRDRDGDGVVDKVVKTTSSNIDGFLDIDFRKSEIDRGEYVRFMYHNATSNAHQLFLRDPAKRLKDADGVFLGLQHQIRSNAIPTTSFTVQVDFYENVNWSWLTTPSTATGSFSASIAVPMGTPYGMYAGAIELKRQGDSMVIPVAVAVAATAPQDDVGNLTGSFSFGGPAVTEAQKDLMYNNGSVFGANDWGWRAESGDWRFFYFDVGKAPPSGSLFLARTEWDDTAPFTDLDTLVFGRSVNHFQLFGDAVFGAPYILDTVGGSPNTNAGAGVWLFDTATGGASDFVTAPVQEGLHALAIHQVGWHGGKFHAPFRTEVGGASVTPSSVVETTADGTGTFDVTFKSTVALDGLAADAFGLSQPTVESVQVQQDNPNDPSTASVKRNITLNHAGRLTVDLRMPSDDLDLYVVRDANNDGTFANSEIVAASATAVSNEFVQLSNPENGNYQIWVQGWAVAGTPTAQLTIDALQGNDLTVSAPPGPVPAGTPVTITVTYSKAGMVNGQDYFGLLTLGPPSAPSAISVPIKVTKTP